MRRRRGFDEAPFAAGHTHLLREGARAAGLAYAEKQLGDVSGRGHAVDRSGGYTHYSPTDRFGDQGRSSRTAGEQQNPQQPYLRVPGKRPKKLLTRKRFHFRWVLYDTTMVGGQHKKGGEIIFRYRRVAKVAGGREERLPLSPLNPVE